MAVSFPATKRYFVSFRNSDTGLAPIFTYFKRTDTLAGVSAPAITELSNGTYYFTVTFTAQTDPDYIFQIDGGVSVPTEEVRYQTSMASPKDLFLDEPISQVKDDVWNDAVNRALGTKGDFVEHVGIDTDAVNAATVFGQMYKARDVVMGGTGFGGTGLDVKTAKESIKGTDDRDLTLLAGSGFATGTDSLKIISDNVDAISTGISGSAPSAAVIAAAVWDETLAGHLAVGSTGNKLNAPSVDNAAIADAVWDEALSGHLTAGTTGEKLSVGSTGGGGSGVQFYANGDTVAPILVQVASPKHNQVRITFSEPVVMTAGANGALNIANYTIPGLTVLLAASLNVQQVLLTTTAQTPNFLYTLEVNNIEDLVGNPIA